MDKKLHINFYSQHSEDIDTDWRHRSCGIVCIKMVLDYLGLGKEEAVMDLIKEGKYIGGYSEENGWNHDALVNLLRNHGVSAYRQEFRSHEISVSDKISRESKYQEKLASVGIGKIISSVEKGAPVIVSVKEGFGTNKTSHLIVITGTKIDNNVFSGFYYIDPNTKENLESEQHFVELARFNSFWRNLAIFTA